MKLWKSYRDVWSYTKVKKNKGADLDPEQNQGIPRRMLKAHIGGIPCSILFLKQRSGKIPFRRIGKNRDDSFPFPQFLGQLQGGGYIGAA